ncbi:MAG: hypothetical protein JWO38_4204 [Gemmataceae bacterium]|nr:hypothetical protein [Gemmataceae bacterium]
MNPPPRRPDDNDLPQLPHRPGEGAAQPTADDPLAPPPAPVSPSGLDPLLDEPRPAAESAGRPARRDSLLDDPLFAEIVDSPAGPDLHLAGPTPVAAVAPLIAEPVSGPAGPDLPVAEPVRPPIEPEFVDVEVVEEPRPGRRPPPSPAEPQPLPRAYPVRPPRASSASPPPPPPPRSRPAFPAPSGARREHVPAAGDEIPAKSRPLAACGVIGCLGLTVVGAVAFLAFVAISVLGHLGDRIGEQSRGPTSGMASAARPGPIGPTELGPREHVVALPGKFDAVGRGAGGRYLFLRIPSRSELVVFDPNKGDLIRDPNKGDQIKSISLGEGEPNALFAAGAAKLFVYKKKTRTVERYDLLSWELEQTTAGPSGMPSVDAVAVGAGSDGPVYLLSAGGGRAGDVRVLDATSLKETAKYQVPEWKRADGNAHARSSDDGTVIGVAGESGAVVLRFNPGSCQARPLRPDGDPPLLATPSPDGEFVYTSRGVFKPDGTPVMKVEDEYFYTFPTAHGKGLYLSLEVKTPLRRVGEGLHLHLANSSLRAGAFPSVKIPRRLGTADEVAEPVPADQRVHLWPAAGLAAVLPSSNDTIELHKVNVESALKSHGGEYLVIGSDPPTTAYRGAEWKYTPVVWTRRGRAQPRVVSGPPGMELRDKDIVWTPSPDFAEESVEVRIQVTDNPTGQNPTTVEQKFRIVAINRPDR